MGARAQIQTSWLRSSEESRAAPIIRHDKETNIVAVVILQPLDLKGSLQQRRRLRCLSGIAPKGPPSAYLVDKGLEYSVGAVLVKLDADLRPKVIGQVVELPARRHRHQ